MRVAAGDWGWLPGDWEGAILPMVAAQPGFQQMGQMAQNMGLVVGAAGMERT